MLKKKISITNKARWNKTNTELLVGRLEQFYQRIFWVRVKERILLLVEMIPVGSQRMLESLGPYKVSWVTAKIPTC